MRNEYNQVRDVLKNIPIKGGYQKFKIENGFQKEIMAYLRTRGWFVYHIEDTSWQDRLLDLHAISTEGIEMYIELKKTDGFSFNLSQFEPGQIKYMLLREKHNLCTFVMIYSQRTNTHIVTTYRELYDQANEKNGIKLFS